MKMNHNLTCDMIKENVKRNKKDQVDLSIEKHNNLELKREVLGNRITDLKLKQLEEQFLEKNLID